MTNFTRKSLGVTITVLLAALASPWTPGLLGCSSNASTPGPFGFDAAQSPSDDAGAQGIPAADAPSGSFEDVTPIVFGDDAAGQNADGAPTSSCSGSALPTATTTTCAIDTSESCPACASWGFVCGALASPVVQGGSASTFCRATPTDAGALVCCTKPVCVVTTVVVTSEEDGGDGGGAGCASTQTRYECSGGAVPTGTCTWLGANAPNDYCCE